MKITTALLIFISTLVVACATETATEDEHHKKVANKKGDYSKAPSKFELGYWATKDCKSLSDGVGEIVAITGYFLDESDKMRNSGNEKGSDEMFGAAERTSTVSANLASTFSAFCK